MLYVPLVLLEHPTPRAQYERRAENSSGVAVKFVRACVLVRADPVVAIPSTHYETNVITVLPARANAAGVRCLLPTRIAAARTRSAGRGGGGGTQNVTAMARSIEVTMTPPQKLAGDVLIELYHVHHHERVRGLDRVCRGRAEP